MNQSSIIDINNFVNDLKEIVVSIFDKLPKLNKEDTFENLVKKYSIDKNFLSQLDKIKILLNKISGKLKELKSFENEFYNFLSIHNMISYIIEDIGRYISYSNFVNNLTISFCNLINFKIRLIKNNEYEKYEEIYMQFDENLFKQEDFFNTNIFESSSEYDNLIDEVTNILG